MSTVETLRVQIDNLRFELQRAQVENARLRDDNASLRDEQPEKAAELDATLDATLKAEQLKLENENLQTELQELRRDLHESREREARTVEEAQWTNRGARASNTEVGNGSDSGAGERRRASDGSLRGAGKPFVERSGTCRT